MKTPRIGKYKVTTLVRCEKCGRITHADKIRGGWCEPCNFEDKPAKPKGQK